MNEKRKEAYRETWGGIWNSATGWSGQRILELGRHVYQEGRSLYRLLVYSFMSFVQQHTETEDNDI